MRRRCKYNSNVYLASQRKSERVITGSRVRVRDTEVNGLSHGDVDDDPAAVINLYLC